MILKTPSAKLRTQRVKQSIHHHRKKKELNVLCPNNLERCSPGKLKKILKLTLAH